MSAIWSNPASWTHEQWLIISILVFIVVAVIVIAWRLVKILSTTKQKRPLPNLRPGKRPGGRS
ncbi:hypothetical protein GCM10011403_08820 [Pseudohongiella nitratireducens]|jgi:membrane protein DedA with SNARE-associated domain|uniref:Uncharacterized protein n=1 Tax=Pseudohongiella nitratireducens TaxID=1768907 RepID=A0A917GQT5_9GAMM|nr:hypothetical protein [Pseudohongiella nitratireducens]MDF1623210.1 hypothetical protein [Pseudohongiella nitratireducens]GGG53901.1 hypothetical protein GCM10011403_08820 [Pseudohongiella nitratireducens]|tara:strand:- start:7148 stop:7336 length:189 start_codon:yes stop_codon:yes gene_type:complete